MDATANQPLQLTDHVIFTVLLPGIVVGLMLIGVYLAIGNRGRRPWPGQGCLTSNVAF